MNTNETIAALFVVAFFAYHLGQAKASAATAAKVDTAPLDPYSYLGWNA